MLAEEEMHKLISKELSIIEDENKPTEIYKFPDGQVVIKFSDGKIVKKTL